MQRSILHSVRRSAIASLQRNRYTVSKTTGCALSTYSSSNFREGGHDSMRLMAFSFLGLAGSSLYLAN